MIEDRTKLIRSGIDSGVRHVAPQAVEAAFVFGDTPLDVIHGRAAGANAVAVASARYSLAELEASHPELLVPDLTAVGPILSFLQKQPHACVSTIGKLQICRKPGG